MGEVNFTNSYKTSIDSLFENVLNLDFHDYVNNVFSENIPSTLQKYFIPEKRYINDLVGELNPYLNEFRENLHTNLRNFSGSSWGKTLDEIVFGDEKKRKEFSEKLLETVEELDYIAKVSSAQIYDIWVVKSNLPGIGKFVRKAVKGKNDRVFEEEDLVDYSSLLNYFNEIKDNTHSFLESKGLSSEKKISEEEVFERYQKRMISYGKMSDGKRLISYDLKNNFKHPKNSREAEKEFDEKIRSEYSQKKSSLEGSVKDFEYYKKRRRRERAIEFIKSDYNSWWEKLISYVSLFFGFY